MKITEIRNILERRKGQRMQQEQQIESLKTEIRNLKKELFNHEKALAVVREVALQTQQQLQYHISDITSMALESVFPDPYEVKIDFVERRNTTECDIYFERDGVRVDPLEASGYGAVDIAAFALRIAAWSMSVPRKRNVIIMDEPMRFVSAEYQEAASAMIKEVSDKLGMQFIIISHNPVMATYADRVFETSIRKGITKIKAYEN